MSFKELVFISFSNLHKLSVNFYSEFWRLWGSKSFMGIHIDTFLIPISLPFKFYFPMNFLKCLNICVIALSTLFLFWNESLVLCWFSIFGLELWNFSIIYHCMGHFFQSFYVLLWPFEFKRFLNLRKNFYFIFKYLFEREREGREREHLLNCAYFPKWCSNLV